MSHRYINKDRRDLMAAALRADGRRIRKSSQRNVTLSPDYIQDYEGTPAPNIVGGAAPEFFPVIYTIDRLD